MNNSYITIIKEKRTDLSRKRIPLNQNGCTADFRMSVPFEQNLQIMDMRGVKPKDIQEYLGFGCVQSVYRWLDGVSMPTVDNLYAISKMLQVPMDSIVCGNAGRTKSQMDACLTDQARRVYTYYKKMRELNAA